MTMESLSLILFRVGRGRKLSDIEYLSIKTFEGKLKKNEGTKSATGTLATLTASTGKDMYIARAKVNYRGSETAGSELAIIELQINGVVVETAEFKSEGSANAGMLTAPYEFKNIGHKVIATQVIKLQVTSVTGSLTLEGFVECFEETTGTTPQIPST